MWENSFWRRVLYGLSIGRTFFRGCLAVTEERGGNWGGVQKGVALWWELFLWSSILAPLLLSSSPSNKIIRLSLCTFAINQSLKTMLPSGCDLTAKRERVKMLILSDAGTQIANPVTAKSQSRWFTCKLLRNWPAICYFRENYAFMASVCAERMLRRRCWHYHIRILTTSSYCIEGQLVTVSMQPNTYALYLWVTLTSQTPLIPHPVAVVIESDVRWHYGNHAKAFYFIIG